MPKLLHARPPRDETERRQVRRLTTSRHAPADWVWHAKMIARSWEGARTSTIAAEVGSHAQTVRERLQAFNERGVDELGLKPGGGRRPRLVEAERSVIIALARSSPPGKLVPEPDSGELQAHDEEGVAEWMSQRLGRPISVQLGWVYLVRLDGKRRKPRRALHISTTNTQLVLTSPPATLHTKGVAP